MLVILFPPCITRLSPNVRRCPNAISGPRDFGKQDQMKRGSVLFSLLGSFPGRTRRLSSQFGSVSIRYKVSLAPLTPSLGYPRRADDPYSKRNDGKQDDPKRGSTSSLAQGSVQQHPSRAVFPPKFLIFPLNPECLGLPSPGSIQCIHLF